MSTLLDEETTTVVLDGLDFEIPCGNGADHKAEVALRCMRCGESSMLCRMHLAAIRRQVESWPRASRVIACIGCRASARDLEALFEVVPL